MKMRNSRAILSWEFATQTCFNSEINSAQASIVQCKGGKTCADDEKRRHNRIIIRSNPLYSSHRAGLSIPVAFDAGATRNEHKRTLPNARNERNKRKGRNGGSPFYIPRMEKEWHIR